MAASSGRQLEDVAVLQQEDVLVGHAGGPGQFGVEVHVAMLAVDGHEVLGPHQVEHHLQLFGGRVARDVHAGRRLVDDPGAGGEQAVDGAVHAGLVARHRRAPR